MNVDPVQQAERFLQDYCRAYGDLGAWAAHPPRHSICFSVIRSLFEAGFAIDDLESILQGLYAEKLKPRSYPWLCAVVKSRIEDLAHERKAGNAPDQNHVG